MDTNATNSTTNYHLPLFVATDKPAWLVDWNNTMTELDTIISGVASGLTNATDALTIAQDAIASLESVVGDAQSGLVKDVADLKNTVGDSDSGLVKRITLMQADLTEQNGLITSLDTRVTALENA